MTIFALTVLAILITSQSCRKISGEGATITRTYSVGTFTSVDAGIDADIYYTPGSTYSVEISAQQNVLDRIEEHVSGSELQIYYTDYAHIWHHTPITIHVTAPLLYGMTINGSGNFYALTPLTTSPLNLKISGSGNINVARFEGQNLTANISGSGNITVSGGSVTDESLKISGSGNIDVLGVTASSASTRTSGSGKTTVNATRTLDVNISGSGDVYYTGNPTMNVEISGSGKVKRL